MIKFEGKTRTGRILTQNGEVRFPLFMPDATYGTINNLSYIDLENTGIKAIVTNTLHLEQKIGSNTIKNQGGFHKFTKWNKPVLTDSGGYQVLSLINRKVNPQNKITDAGCSFIDFDTGKYNFLSPETSQIIQHNIGSDIRVVLDEPIINSTSLISNIKSVERTTAWALRSKNEFLKLNNLTELDFENTQLKRPLLTAVIQGGKDFKLRKRSLEELVEIGFDIYGFGGVPVRERKTWNYTDQGGFYKELLHFLAENLPKDKLRYALGVGTPDNIDFAISVGWDIFDTVLPTRNARHGYLYVSKGSGDEDFDKYSVLRIKNKTHEYEDMPIDPNCDCITCKTTSRAFLRYLIRINEGSGMRLATIHNLTFYAKFIESCKPNG